MSDVSSPSCRGQFITLEGGDGSGKSTCLQTISQFLTQNKINHISTHEPGGTPLAENIRDLLLSHHHEAVASDTELLLMFASRAQHLAEVIRPALAANKWILCSRFTDSTYAYQGGGRGIDSNRIATLESFVHADCQPDLTFVFDLPVDVAQTRVNRRAAADRIESEKLAFFERVRVAYIERAKTHPRYHVIDATQPIDVVNNQVLSILGTLLPQS